MNSTLLRTQSFLFTAHVDQLVVAELPLGPESRDRDGPEYIYRCPTASHIMHLILGDLRTAPCTQLGLDYPRIKVAELHGTKVVSVCIVFSLTSSAALQAATSAPDTLEHACLVHFGPMFLGPTV